MDGAFADLGVSFFDEDFTLDPFPYIEDLYARTSRDDSRMVLCRCRDCEQHGKQCQEGSHRYRSSISAFRRLAVMRA